MWAHCVQDMHESVVIHSEHAREMTTRHTTQVPVPVLPRSSPLDIPTQAAGQDAAHNQGCQEARLPPAHCARRLGRVFIIRTPCRTIIFTVEPEQRSRCTALRLPEVVAARRAISRCSLRPLHACPLPHPNTRTRRFSIDERTQVPRMRPARTTERVLTVGRRLVSRPPLSELYSTRRARRSGPTRSPMDAEICEFIRSRPAGTVDANSGLKIGP